MTRTGWNKGFLVFFASFVVFMLLINITQRGQVRLSFAETLMILTGTLTLFQAWVAGNVVWKTSYPKSIKQGGWKIPVVLAETILIAVFILHSVVGLSALAVSFHYTDIKYVWPLLRFMGYSSLVVGMLLCTVSRYRLETDSLAQTFFYFPWWEYDESAAKNKERSGDSGYTNG